MTDSTNKTRMTKTAYLKKLKGIKRNGSRYLQEFLEIVPEGVHLYYGESNYNVSIVNELIDAANALKGLRVLALQDYLSNVIPHVLGGRKEQFHFGAKDPNIDAKVMEAGYKAFLEKNPDWTLLNTEKPPKPISIEALIKSVQSRLNKGYKNNDINNEDLEVFKKAVSSIQYTTATVVKEVKKAA